MSIECAECEHDLRGGHDPSCSRYRPPCEHCGGDIEGCPACFSEPSPKPPMPTPETRDAAPGMSAVAQTFAPCPFCGGEARPDRVLRDGCKDGEPDAWAYFLRCISCAAQGPWFKTVGNAARTWNTPTPEAPDAHP